jgi:uncharacterized protein YtpQ (UPF0354 family)
VRAAIALLLGLAACAPPEPSELDPAGFTQAFLERLRREHPGLDAKIQGDLRIAVESGGRRHDLHLENAYAEYRAAPEDLEETLAWYVRSMFETIAGESREEIDRVIPVVRSADYAAKAAAALRESNPNAPAPELALEAINEDLVVVYAFRLGGSLRLIWRQELESFGAASPADLRSRAVENLRRTLPKIERTAEGYAAGGTHESSLLLFDELWTPEACPVRGEILVAVPSSDALLVADSEDPEGLARLLRRVAEIAAQNRYALSTKVFVRRGGRWVRF